MLRLILFIIIALLVLSFFGISLRTLVLSPTAQDNFAFVWSIVVNAWNSLLVWLQGLSGSFSQLKFP